MKQVLHYLWVITKIYCVAVGILTTVLVAQKLVAPKVTEPAGLVKGELNINLPALKFSNQPKQGEGK